MSKLTGKYNEYGYAIFKGSQSVYAAGNSPYESQVYVGSRLIFGGTSVSKGTIPEDASILDTKKIAKYCESTLVEMCDYPERWDWKLEEGVEYELGSVKFSRDLNPLEQAYKCGALSR